MLVVGNATNQTRSNHDRRRREGAGTPADVWALGCLLYELLTGRILFYDPDWIRFFIRLTQSKEVHPIHPFSVAFFKCRCTLAKGFLLHVKETYRTVLALVFRLHVATNQSCCP